ncbi:MAG: class I SAM-dependent methyltransferase [Acidobacteriia bacterium]|nr:class I SAM-dependent methyltransferase [Terriglobia bacterium]
MNDEPQGATGKSRRRKHGIYDSPTGAKLYNLWGRLTESRAHTRALEAARLAPGESVLEVAVGTGQLFFRLRQVERLKRCIGVELAPGMLDQARRRLARTPHPQGALCRADARHLPFPAQTFDLILNTYMLDLLSEGEIHEVLTEFRRTLRPGGRLILLVMAKQNWLVQGMWMWAYAHCPTLVGGCRPVALDDFFAMAGWRIESREQISQNGFRSEMVVARIR